jgi:predicted phosphodiesterase
MGWTNGYSGGRAVKIRIWSDLHQDGARFLFDKNCQDEVLVLAGDTSNSLAGTVNFINGIHDLFKAVIVVAGNHEYYRHDPLSTFTELFRAEFAGKNVHLLNPDSVKIDAVTFIGGTLWSDFNRGDPLCMWAAQRGINDFRLIETKPGVRITPEWMIRQCEYELNFIREECKRVEGKKVIVTHFPMLRDFQHPKWGSLSENPLNGYFMSDFSHKVMDLEFDLAVAGHTHSSAAFEKYGKRWVANPRGYCYKGIAENEEWDENLVISV